MGYTKAFLSFVDLFQVSLPLNPTLTMHHFQGLTRLKMSPTILLLLLSGLASLATAINETLCEALTQHRYKEMALLSFTFYKHLFSTSLLIFTQPGYRCYELELGKVTLDSMDLSEASLRNITESRPTAYTPVIDHTHRGTYLFTLFHFWQWSLYKWKLIFLIVTDKGTRSGSYSKNSDTFEDVSDGQALPDFTLAGMGYDSSKDLFGYVLSEDLDRFPGYIILGQYKVFWEGSNVTGLPLPAGQTDDRPFFFLQVMDHPFEVFLIHSRNKPDPDAQLLRSVPRAFLYDKKHLVLFDTVNGCVHIVHDFAGFNVDDIKSRAFKRSNYPFEVYFKCGKAIDNPNPNRCNVVRGSHRPTDVTPENQQTPSTESVDSFSLGPTASVYLVLVAVIVVGLIIALRTKVKAKGTKGRSAGKWSTSSSAVNGTSKTGNKSTVAKSSISCHGAKSKSTSKGAKNLQASKTSISK